MPRTAHDAGNGVVSLRPVAVPSNSAWRASARAHAAIVAWGRSLPSCPLVANAGQSLRTASGLREGAMPVVEPNRLRRVLWARVTPTDLPEPARQPPRGVPRWLWPPPGASVSRVVVREEATPAGPRHHVVEGVPPEKEHLRALQWLVGEYPREDDPAPHTVADILVEIARTELRGGRVGHAYALNGAALGAPGSAAARGVLWRYAISVLGRAPPDFDQWSPETF